MANFNAHTLYNNDQLTDASTAAIILVIYPNGIVEVTYRNIGGNGSLIRTSQF